ncbi:hypothetical protein RW25_07110 [Bacillus sp. L_1B0_8]|uniref:hypothetical protein n=1 Tax=Bacillus TaxID=1386 RepID=UPI0005B6D8F5|nr:MULTISPECIES: hypothetical protein [unclassified Bacillus (in: firmicutes)]KIQ88506.1 hypothetical protein RT27_10015 [Bacillus sp. L_1B0_5]KIQ90867.1 hypothetical protein RW25_07110 [Bacillus sp. L_1B0_8]
MKVKVSSINDKSNLSDIFFGKRYSADVTLKETVLGQEKSHKEYLELPDVINVKVSALFKEIEEYIDNSREGGSLEVRLDFCKDETAVGCHIYYGEDKITTYHVVNGLFEKSKSSLAYGILDQIKRWFGWGNDSKQKLILYINLDDWEEEVIAILRAYSDIQVVDMGTPEKE